MSIEEITYWGFVVPKYKKDKSSYRNTSFDWNDEVFVVITTTLTKFTYACSEFVFKNQNHIMKKNANCHENGNPKKVL